MGWVGHSYFGVDHWIATEQSWDRLKRDLAEDQYIELRYEGLLAEPELVLRDICEFLMVPYSSEMLRYHLHSTYDLPDKQLAFQWKSKLSKREVRLIESKVRTMIAERDYDPSGYEPLVLSRVELAFLILLNKGRWISPKRLIASTPSLFIFSKEAVISFRMILSPLFIQTGCGLIVQCVICCSAIYKCRTAPSSFFNTCAGHRLH